MATIWRNYLENWFFVKLHIAVAVLSVGILLAWFRDLWRIRNSARVSAVSDSVANQLVESLAVYPAWFDYCSSAFIFVGLLGTMNGFVKAMAYLRVQDYDFKDIQVALSTSAMGIVWAVLFSCAVLVAEYLFGRPTLSYLRRGNEGERAEASLQAQLGRIEKALIETLSEFRRSTGEVVLAVDGWKERIDSLGQKYTAIASGILTTAEQFKETYIALTALPERVRKELAAVFREGRDSFSTTLNSIKGSLKSFESVPGKIERGIDESFAKRKQVVEAALQRYTEELDKQRLALAEVYAKTDTVPLRIAEVLKTGTETSVILMEKAHQEFLARLASAVRSTVEDQIEIIGEASGKLRLTTSQLRESWERVLADERGALRDAIAAALEEVNAVVENQREQLLKLESTLPESLATTFTSLIVELKESVRLLDAAVNGQRDATKRIDAALGVLTEAARSAKDVPVATASRGSPPRTAAVGGGESQAGPRRSFDDGFSAPTDGGFLEGHVARPERSSSVSMPVSHAHSTISVMQATPQPGTGGGFQSPLSGAASPMVTPGPVDPVLATAANETFLRRVYGRVRRVFRRESR